MGGEGKVDGEIVDLLGARQAGLAVFVEAAGELRSNPSLTPSEIPVRLLRRTEFVLRMFTTSHRTYLDAAVLVAS
jgi:hypothetical protein